MIILHENMQEEAQETASALKQAYGLESKLVNENLDKLFDGIAIPEFNGYHPLSWGIIDYAASLGKAVLILTPRDLYADNKSKEDDWVFGSMCTSKDLERDQCLGIVSSARMKRNDNQASNEIIVPKSLYLRRISATGVHEIGHDVVKAPHLKQAKLVNAKTGYELPLGLHCNDNGCIMYEIIDIKAPPREESYLLLGDEKKFDAGLDEVIARMHPDWLCGRCKQSILIDNKYQETD